MKKILAAIVCLCLFLSGVNVYALDANTKIAETERIHKLVFAQVMDYSNIEQILGDAGSKLIISSTETLYSFTEKPIAILYRFLPQGYAIFDPVAEIVLEYNTDCNHPAYVNSGGKYYYDGVLRYFKKVGNKFENLLTGAKESAANRIINTSQDFYVTQLPQVELRAIGSELIDAGRSLPHQTLLYNCNTTDNVAEFYPTMNAAQLANVGGVCGSLACATIVAYYDSYFPEMAGNGDFATDSKKYSGSKAEHTYGIELVKEFVPYIEPNGNGSIFLNGGMSQYLAAHGIDGGLSLGLFSVYDAVKNIVEEDFPSIVGLYEGHYCVAIGYKNVNGKYIKVDYGHGYNSWITASSAGSVWTLYVD